MQKKDDKVDNKIPYKEEWQRKTRERERKIEIDSQVEILTCVHARKTKELFYYIRSVGCKTHFLAILR